MIRLSLLVVSLSILAGATLAEAGLVAHDGFDYGSGQSLQSQNGGTGFAGSWFGPSSTTNYSIGSDSLGYTGVPTSGGRVNAARVTGSPTAWMRRELPASRDNPFGDNGTTMYFSMLFRPTGTSLAGEGFAVLSFVQPGLFGSVGNELTFGLDSSGTFGIGQLGGIGRVNSNDLPTLNQTSLLVLKAEFNASSSSNDQFTLFVDPVLGTGEPGFGLVKNDFNLGTIDEIAIRSTASFEIDEIRIGTTFDSVTSVPEPGCAAFVLALFALDGRRRRPS